MKKSSKIRLVLSLLVVVVFAFGLAIATQRLRRTNRDVPTVRVKLGTVELKVYTRGELRSSRSGTLVAPAVGGNLQIIKLAKTGTAVRVGEVVIEFDPSEQEHDLKQSGSELLQAEQEIVKSQADAAVQSAQDQVALLKARFDVRRAELDVSRNEIESAIEAKKNLLNLEEAKRRLSQLEQDIQSHASSAKASLAVVEEKRNKAQLMMQQARKNIESMRVTSPISGLVAIKENSDLFGGPTFGLALPEFREGDQVSPGRQIAQIDELNEMEIQSKVSESDRANFNPGQGVEVRVDAWPGKSFGGKIRTVAGMASRDWWSSDTTGRFDVTFQLERLDPRIRPGVTAQVVIAGDQVKDALYLPRQALFEKDRKHLVYVKRGDRFEAHEVKIKYRDESQVVIEGLEEGAEVALVNPDEYRSKPAKNSGPLAAPTSGGGV
jgi:multidrug efflux pump subunit AcrA (membrane-fusion protein)